jgi:hypothetical protein
MVVGIESQERYFRLDGVVFRIRMDRLDLGSEHLRRGRWVWSPITSGSILHNPRALELSSEEKARYSAITDP